MSSRRLVSLAVVVALAVCMLCPSPWIGSIAAHGTKATFLPDDKTTSETALKGSKTTPASPRAFLAVSGSAGIAGRSAVAVNGPLMASLAPLALAPDGQISEAAGGGTSEGPLVLGSDTITTAAGNGNYGYTGDGGPAGSATFNGPFGVAMDAAGNLYIADRGNNRIRAVNTQASAITVLGVSINPGDIATVAGGGSGGDGGPATSAQLNNPYRVAVDTAGNLYIADTYSNRIRKVDAKTQVITTVAGNGAAGYAGDGSSATSAQLNYPAGVALDAAGNLYIADQSNSRVRAVNTQASAISVLGVTIAPGNIATVAGNGGFGYSGDGGPATSASVYDPMDVAVERGGQPVHRRCSELPGSQGGGDGGNHDRGGDWNLWW